MINCEVRFITYLISFPSNISTDRSARLVGIRRKSGDVGNKKKEIQYIANIHKKPANGPASYFTWLKDQSATYF
jgi:hypothetical protein